MADKQKQQTRDRIGLRIMALRRTLTKPMIGSLGEALNKKVTEVFIPKDTE